MKGKEILVSNNLKVESPLEKTVEKMNIKDINFDGINLEEIINNIKNEKISNGYTDDDHSNKVYPMWRTLDNTCLRDIDVNIDFDKCENFTDFFKIDEDGKLKNGNYLKNFFEIVYGKIEDPNDDPTSPNHDKLLKLKKAKDILTKGIKEENKSIKESRLIDPDGDTLVYTPNLNRNHEELERILLDIPGIGKYGVDNEKKNINYLVKVLDGNTTDNKNCEDVSLDCSRRSRENNKNKKMIFITTMMGNRSFSNMFIKNIILFMNEMGDDTLAQRISRGLTFWNKDHNMCYIVDFRLKYDQPSAAEQYVWYDFQRNCKQTKEDVTKYSDNYKKLIKESSSKYTYLTYINLFGDDFDQIYEKKSDDWVEKALISKYDFTKTYISQKINYVKIVKELNSEGTIINNIKSIKDNKNHKNIKGDSDKFSKTQENNAESNKENNVNKDVKKLQEYLNVLLNYGDSFNRSVFEENIVERLVKNWDVEDEFGSSSMDDYLTDVCEFDENDVKVFRILFEELNKNLSSITTDPIFSLNNINY